jgi:hypothetical protein
MSRSTVVPFGYAAIVKDFLYSKGHSATLYKPWKEIKNSLHQNPEKNCVGVICHGP